MQTRLKELGYYQGKVDGKFGRASVNALKNFQTNNALNADGIAGKKTYAKLFNASAVPFAVAETPAPASEIPQAAETPAAVSSFWTTLRTGDSGTDVKQLQENLIQLGYLTGTADGDYGAKTVEAVRDFQKANNLTADGTAGADHPEALYGGTAKEAPKATPRPHGGSFQPSGTLKTGKHRNGCEEPAEPS